MDNTSNSNIFPYRNYSLILLDEDSLVWD